MKNSDLTAQFLIEGIDQDELIDVLQTIYMNVAFHSVKEIVFYESNPSNYSLLVRYKDEQISSITRGPALTPEGVAPLLQKIHAALLENQNTVVGGLVLLCLYPTTGYVKVGNELLIRPVPDSVPEPNTAGLAFTAYPFVLEYKYKYSSDFQVRNCRSMSKGAGLGWILHTLLEGNVTIPITERATSHWVITKIDRDSDGKSIRTYAYCPDGIPRDSVPLDADDFTSVDRWQALDTVDPQTYYTYSSPRGKVPLRVPVDLAESIAKYYALDPARQSAFLRACYWNHLAGKSWDYSDSSAYIALVSAIEALLPPPPPTEICPKCKRPIQDGPTKRFKEFFEEYITGDTTPRNVLDSLYDLRSELAHGSGLLPGDFPGYFSHFTPHTRQKAHFYSEMSRVVTIGLYNWLQRQK